jgi:hypothetical protein
LRLTFFLIQHNEGARRCCLRPFSPSNAIRILFARSLEPAVFISSTSPSARHAPDGSAILPEDQRPVPDGRLIPRPVLRADPECPHIKYRKLVTRVLWSDDH